MLLAFVMALLCACKGEEKNSDALPENFSVLSIEDKMKLLEKNSSPEETAERVCDIAMGKVRNARIELSQAIVYVYEHYDQKDRIRFLKACDNYQAALPIYDKAKYYKLKGENDPDRYGFILGMEYLREIRSEKKTVQTIEEEIDRLMRECRFDPDFYRRFIKGFKTVLEEDSVGDLDEEIYNKFIIYPDTITQ